MGGYCVDMVAIFTLSTPISTFFHCCDGIKPQPEKISAMVAIKPPTSVKELHKFLGMVQYYRDLSEKHSHMLAPLTNLVGACGHTKATRAKGTKWQP